VLRLILAKGSSKEDRVAAGLKAARIQARSLKDPAGAVSTYEQVLDLAPGQPDALTYLAEAYTSTAQDWDHLVALYEDQLKASSSLRGDAEQGILLQIAMVHWRMRGARDAAEPYFDRLRRVDPSSSAMLSFFREHAEADGSPGAKQKLATILTEAQRSTHDAALKKELGAEIARLAESSDNALKAIEQYKSILKADPADADAHEALKRLYGQVANWPALVDVLRHELERLPADDKEKRVAVLSEIASIHRDRAKNEQQLVQVLQQIVQLDDTNAPALRELVRIYEALGRFRDLLTCQQRLAELTEDAAETRRPLPLRCPPLGRAVLERAERDRGLRGPARGPCRTDEEARAKLRELYTKRRAWGQLYALYEIAGGSTPKGRTRSRCSARWRSSPSERLDRGADAILAAEEDPRSRSVGGTGRLRRAREAGRAREGLRDARRGARARRRHRRPAPRSSPSCRSSARSTPID
jgi:tetratricopeptide (TPR) repeat protein